MAPKDRREEDSFFISAVEFLKTLIDERDDRYSQKFEDLDKAITKAETATEKRFEGVNEFRQQQADMIKTFARKVEMDLQFDNINNRLLPLEKAQQTGVGKSQGISQVWFVVCSVGALGASIIAIVMHFVK